MHRSCLHWLVAAVAISALTHPAHAQQKEDKVAAEALFQEGKRLLEAGQADAACPKLAESHRLDPAVGTLLWLADCYESQGKTATAWATFHSAASAAQAAGQRQREKIARDKIAALQGKLATLTLTVTPTSDVQGLEISRDGVQIKRAVWGVAVPVDPEEHTISATAPGRKPWSSKVAVAASATIQVTVPVLELVDSPAAIAPAPASVGATDHADSPAARQGSWMRPAGLVAAGVGVAGVVIGSVYAAKKASKQDDARAQCLDYPNECTNEGIVLNEEAGRAGTVATVGLVAGGALIAAGVILYLAAPSSPSTQTGANRISVSPAMGRNETGLVLRGMW